MTAERACRQEAGIRDPPYEFAHASDEALVALAAAGRQEAMTVLYGRYGSVAYGLAMRIARDRQLAENALQDGFLAVWHSACRYSRAQGTVRTWLLTLVHRRAVDVVRTEARIRRFETPHEPPELMVGDAVDETVELRDERRLVQAALGQLRHEQRQALELAYYGGLTQLEIADRLQQPLGTIKSRMFHGLARLRGLLAAEQVAGTTRRPPVRAVESERVAPRDWSAVSSARLGAAAAGPRDARFQEPQQLRVLIANERRNRLQLLARVVTALGHEVIAREIDVTEVGAATARLQPDVALVGLGLDSQHALDLITEIVREASCPVVALLSAPDPAYVHDAAARGVFAYIVDSSPEGLQGSIDVTLQRFAEYQGLQGAFGRRALIEQAKGILMARHATDADRAFGMLRNHSQQNGRKLVDVAQAVVDSHLLLLPVA